jgi:hypothetical protein
MKRLDVLKKRQGRFKKSDLLPGVLVKWNAW